MWAAPPIAPAPQEGRMTIHRLTIETARPRPSAGFHGQVEIGHWFVDDDTVWLGRIHPENKTFTD